MINKSASYSNITKIAMDMIWCVRSVIISAKEISKLKKLTKEKRKILIGAWDEYFK